MKGQPHKNVLIMSRAIDTRISKTLDALENKSTLTPDGRDWLVAALDPFHDQDMSLAGYPDLMTSSTVVQLVKQSFSVGVPSTVTTPTWDCIISMFPNQITQNMTTSYPITFQGVVGNGVVLAPVSTVGGVVAIGGNAGVNLYPNNAGGNAADATAKLCGGTDARNFLKGNCRVIGCAFEIVNTTAEINKQGQMTAWRMPNFQTDVNVVTQSTTTPSVGLTSTITVNRFPPGSLSDAMLLYGSRSWAAKEGAYVVGRQSDVDNPARQPSTKPNVFVGQDINSGTTGAQGNYNVYSNAISASSWSACQDVSAPFDLSGIYCSGLSTQTTLTVNVRWIIERVPGPSESDLVVLATPSCPFDALALEIYTKCLRDMPPGVMFNENPLGEWFRAALSKVASFAPKIGAAINTIIPGAELIGNGLGAVAGFGAKKLQQKAERKAGAPKPPPMPKKKPPMVPSRAGRPALSGSASNASLMSGKSNLRRTGRRLDR